MESTSQPENPAGSPTHLHVTDPSEASGSSPAPASSSKATASKPRKRFVGKKSVPGSSSSGNQPSSSRSVPHSSVPQEILHDPALNAAIAQNLPANYEFEVHKTIWNIKKWNSKMVGLQMPEGLLMWSCILSDIIERFTSAQTVILGDVTYGACCIDDYTALALGCDMLVHYGHSCLVPIDTTSIRTLYVFVEISIDSEHLANTIRLNLPSDRGTFLRDIIRETDSDADDQRNVPIGTVIGGRKRITAPQPVGETVAIEESNDKPSEELITSTPSPERTRLALVSTIQFASALNKLKEDLSVARSPPPQLAEGTQEEKLAVVPHSSDDRLDQGSYEIIVPRSKPLSPGEILGCTAPRLKDVDAILYLADGRFHLEAIMIANPDVPAFKFDPYSKKLTREWYDHEEMRSLRGKAIRDAKATIPSFIQEERRPELRDSQNELTNGISTDVAELTNGSRPPTCQQVWGVILGTLGRQGSLRQMEAILRQLDTFGLSNSSWDTIPKQIPYMPILLSELSPGKLALFNASSGEHTSQNRDKVTTFIQTSCPRLSIDWGYAFDKPLLSPYEAAVALGRARSWEVEDQEGVGSTSISSQRVNGVYPMNFYEAGSIWATSRVQGKETVWPVQVVA